MHTRSSQIHTTNLNVESKGERFGSECEEEETESIQEKQARSFCLLANSNGQRRKPIHVRMGGSALHHHRQHWTTRREESSGRAGVGLKPRRPSRGGSRPAPAERGRDRHWHWQAGGLVPGRARFGISRGVCCAGGVRARRGGGWPVDRSHLPSSDGRSLPCAC